jgi:hypothetical protein
VNRLPRAPVNTMRTGFPPLEGRVSEVDRSRQVDCHWMLLRMAGALPDDLLYQCRRWLGLGRVAEVGRAIAFIALATRLRLPDHDFDLFAEILSASGADASVLALVEVVDEDPMSLYGFAPTWQRAELALAATDDAPPAQMMADAVPEDVIDRAAVTAATSAGVFRALWRAWRFPVDGSPWPAPRRVWVLETDVDTDLVVAMSVMLDALDDAGETYPQVEVYPVGAELPSYQRMGRGYGGLLWARDPGPDIRIAPEAEPDSDDRSARLADTEREAVVSYLSGGESLIVTDYLADDAFDESRPAVVPTDLRTDGHWIWSDASAYYADTYGIAPHEELLAHIRDRDYRSPVVDGAAVFRALATIQAAQ